MSVETEADRLRDQARKEAHDLMETLSKLAMADNQLWGWKDYTDEYKAKVRKAFAASMELRELIG